MVKHTTRTLIITAAILASGAAIATALSIHTTATQQQDYHACIIAAAEHVNPSDYGAESAHDIARLCQVSVYGQETER